LIVTQLRRAGLTAELVATPATPAAPARSDVTADAARRRPAPAWDLRVEVTHGVPYDPYTTAVSRFTPPTNDRNAASPPTVPFDPQLTSLLERAMATPEEAARAAIYTAIQARLDHEAIVVPLYAPRRIALLRRGMPLPRLDHDMYRLDARFLTDPVRGR
jgi:ABC-type transport system substrate-binding protein